MALVVIDWSQSRRTGFSLPRKSTISRKISSPSRPASQAFTTASTSSRCSSLPMVRMRSLCPFFFLSSKRSGRMGRLARVQRLYSGSISSGGRSSSRCPTANVTR
jgi:hypothetical protein